MNKVITTAAVILCLAGAAKAGDARTSHGRSTAMASSAHQILIGVDGDFALPVGNYSKFNGVGGGALLTVEYPLMEQLSLTGRAGFQFHADASNRVGTATVNSHAHAVPVLLGTKYYVMQTDRQGLFAAAEVGMFALMAGASSGAISSSDTQMKFGVGIGAGYQWKEWNFRVNGHSQDIGTFGDSFVISGGVGYQFAGF
jgi:hypothetical protein